MNTDPGGVTADLKGPRGDGRSGQDVGKLDELPAKVALLDGEGTILYTNEAWRRSAAKNGFRDSPGMVGHNYLAAIDPNKSQSAHRAASGIRALLAGERETISLTYPCEMPDGERYFSMKAIRREIDDKPFVLVIHVDVTGADQPENDVSRQWATIREAIDPLMTATSKEFIAAVAIEALSHTLDVAYSAVYHFDEDSGQLRRAASSSTQDTVGPIPDTADEKTSIWRAFSEQRTIHTRNGVTEEGADLLSPLLNQLIVPIDGRGVLTIGRLEPDAFEAHVVEFATALAGIVELALESFEQRQLATAYDRRLQRHTDRFEEIDLLYTVLRDITRAAERGTTRREIHREICETVVDIDPFTYAWIGDRPDGEAPFEVWEWASDDSQVGTSPVADGQFPDTHPAHEALATGDLVVYDDLTSLDRDQWVTDALLNGYRWCVAIPLLYRGTKHGVLTIFSRETSAISPEIERVLSEIVGPIIAQTMSAIDRKDGVLSKRTTKIELRIEDKKPHPVRIAAELDCELTLEELEPDSATPAIAYLSVDGASPEAVVDVSNQQGGSQAASVHETGVVELPHDHCVATLLAEHGCRITSYTADPEGLDLSVAVPKTIAPKRLVNSVADRYKDVEVRSITKNSAEKYETETLLDESLTSRQQEVLEAAYRDGYIAWPRDARGEEIAEQLEISQPTFNQHLWSAFENLLDRIFEDTDGTIQNDT